VKKLLERSRRRWKDNIKIDLRELKLEAWTGSIWFKKGTGCCECCNEISGSTKYFRAP
jgi:hypothetical protein